MGDEACICNTGPGTDGPDECCPQHGRPYAYWVEWGDRAYARGWTDALAEAARVTRDAMDAATQTADEGFHDLRNPGVVPTSTTALTTSEPGQRGVGSE